MNKPKGRRPAVGGRQFARGSVAVIVLGAAVGFAGSAVGEESVPTSVGEVCAWQAELSPRTLDEVNFALPDSGAWYWILPYSVRPDLRITVSGRFPQARYMSFNTYDATFSSFSADGVASSLPDYRIAPDPGSNNPWQRAGQAGTYTVDVAAQRDLDRTDALPAARQGVNSGIGYLVYRVYLPADGMASVELPQVRISDSDGTRDLAACVRSDGARALDSVLSPLGQAGLGLPATPTDPLSFRRVSGVGAFPNVDNAYLAAVFTPPSDDRVVVVRGRAPRVPTGNGPSVWPPRQEIEVRYYSLCTNLAVLPGPLVFNVEPDGSTENGCRTDEQTNLDSAGNYTYVLAGPTQRDRIREIPGATYVPISREHPDTPEVVLLRNMLPAEGFDHSVQDVAVGDTAEHAAATMGPYYPRITVCTVAQLSGGQC